MLFVKCERNYTVYLSVSLISRKINGSHKIYKNKSTKLSIRNSSSCLVCVLIITVCDFRSLLSHILRASATTRAYNNSNDNDDKDQDMGSQQPSNNDQQSTTAANNNQTTIRNHIYK